MRCFFQVIFGGVIALESGTGLNVFAGVDEQLVSLGLKRAKFLVSAASDGAGAMLGPVVGFQSRLLRASPISLGWHCMGHKQALKVKAAALDISSIAFFLNVVSYLGRHFRFSGKRTAQLRSIQEVISFDCVFFVVAQI